ncbi:hypothetical protein TNCV_1738181 [Trichonephila clavipes]|nr:hypothetical protein TNCV_1738181 [Trichonephila clavipes]
MSNHQSLDSGMRSIKRKPGQGSSKSHDRHLSTIAKHMRGATVSQSSRYLYVATGSRVLRVAVSKRLHERGCCLRLAHVYEQESPFSLEHTELRLE